MLPDRVVQGGEREWDNATWLQRSSTLWPGLPVSYATEEVCEGTRFTHSYAYGRLHTLNVMNLRGRVNK